MKHNLYILLLFLAAVQALQAQNAEQVWVTGINDFPGLPGYGNLILRFGNGGVQAEPANLRMNFESTMATATDSLGNLLFYTNGCYIANAMGDTMLGSSGLNPGDMHLRTCPTAGYASPLGAMILPMPDSKTLFYLFHMGVRYEAEKKLTYGPFYYTVVDVSLDGGKGGVVSKNNLLADGKLEPFTAVRHGNGRDWWLVMPEYGTNQYRRFLFSKTGIQQSDTQTIGEALSCPTIGSSAFALNGTRYARQQNCSIVILDFDRCAGQFSNPRMLSMPSHAFGGGGVAFSPDASRVFTNTQLSVLDADLSQINPQLDTLVDWLSIAGNNLHLMQYGPDGKIYMSSLSRSPFYHVIAAPDALGSAIGFVPRALKISATSVRTLPNSPNFRLGDLHNSPCDTLGITPVAEPQTAADFAVSVSPNPAHSEVTLRDFSPENVAQERTWRVFSSSGTLVRSTVLPPGTAEHRLDLRGLPPGMYWWEMARADGRRVAGKLAVQR